uniref:Sister chromatid cohesion protein PDS5 A n=1 Tax=Haemonchus contortus TaxID=6289 RepID=A0A7I4Y9Y5_HAECO
VDFDFFSDWQRSLCFGSLRISMMADDVEYPPNCLPILYTNGTSELVKRLKILSEALQASDTNDECGQPDRYRSLICHLSDSRFLANSSKDVQIWLACCLADILRIFAPNVPLGDPTQLKEVLLFLVKTLKGLESPSNPLFRRYFYLLENISVVSTLVLCLELPHDESSQVIRMLIKTAMEVANGKEWKGEIREASDESAAIDDDGEDKSESRDKVIALLIGIISKLLRDVDQVSAEILDVLFFYLINPQKLNNRESYNMARQIIQVSQTSLEAAIQSLLTQSLLAGALPRECDLVGSARKKLYDVILELHGIAPELMAPVLPQLSSSLRAEDDQQRLLATKLVGKLVSNTKTRFYDDHPKLWKYYMDRFKDTFNEVREVCAKDSHEILLQHSQLRGQISSALGSLTRDLDDSVRHTAVLCIIETARKKLEAVNESLIVACCDRMKDKKPKVRQDVITKLLHLYYKVVMGDEYTMSEIAAVAIIPKRALALYMLASMTEEKLMIERYFSSYIIPYKMEMPKRVRSMVDLFDKLDEFEAQVFAEIVTRSSRHRRILREMLEIISRQTASDDKVQLQSKIQRISSTHHDPAGFSIALKHFANLLSTDQRCFEYAEYLVSNEYSTARVEEVCKELVTHSVDAGNIPKDCLTNIRRYVERVAPLIMDQDSTAEFLRVVLRVKSDADCGNLEASAKLPSVLRLLKIWGEAFPHLFSRSDSIHSLLKIIASDDAKAVEIGLQVLYHVTLQSSFKVKDQEWWDTAVSHVWSILVSESDGFGRCCKLAVRVVCRLLGKEECTTRFNEIYSEIEDRVCMDNPGACINALQVISEFHRDLPKEFGARVKTLIAQFVVPGIILSPLSEEPEDGATTDLSVPLEEQPVSRFCLPKVYGMKLLARYLFTCSGDAEDDALATKTFKMFMAFIKAAGDLHEPDKKISTTEKAWLRAVAGASLLKLCYVQKYSQMIDVEMFTTLGNLMIDSAECVRSYFVKRLNKGIMRNRLTVEYMALFSLVDLLNATNDEEESAVKSYREQCRSLLISAVSRRRSLIQSPGFSPMYLPYHQPEYAIAYSIWLLAHQPILNTHSDLASMAILQECLWFVMEPFTSKKESTDFEFIYRMLQDIKESNDAYHEKRRKEGEIGQAEVVGQSKKMWALADLGMLMLTYRGKATIRHEQRKPVLSNRFFIRDKNYEHAGVVCAPLELIESEKERNGKPPSDPKRRFLNTTSNATLVKKTAARKTKKRRNPEAIATKARSRENSFSSVKNASTMSTRRKDMNVEKDVNRDAISSPESIVRSPAPSNRRRKPNDGKELDRGDAVPSPQSKNNAIFTRKKTDRTPLKDEQENVAVQGKLRHQNKNVLSSPADSPPGSRGKISLRSPSKGEKKKPDMKPLKKASSKNIPVVDRDDDAAPSTSKEPLSSRNLRSSSTQRQLSSPAKQALPEEKSPRKPASQVSNGHPLEPTRISPRKNLKSSSSSTTEKPSSPPNLADGINLSPITRSGLRISSRGKSRTLPLSTSTPMPGVISHSEAQKKRARQESSPTQSQPIDDLEEPRRKKPIAAVKSRTPSKQSKTPNGSPAKVKTASKPSPRSKRSRRPRGKAL